MDTSTIAIIIALVGAVVSVISVAASQKKTNNEDGLKLGEFMGEIKTDIRNIKETIQAIKNDRAEDKETTDNSIRHAIREHEKIYHGKG